jgi:hypothetical protein
VSEYAHIGDPRRMDGNQCAARDKVRKLCMGWLARVRRVRRCNQREFAELTNGGFGSIVEAFLVPAAWEECTVRVTNCRAVKGQPLLRMGDPSPRVRLRGRLCMRAARA